VRLPSPVVPPVRRKFTGNAELFVLKLGRPEAEAVNITNSEVDESQVDWR
jgi:hypothetical protein